MFDIEKATITSDNVLVVPVALEQDSDIMSPIQYADKPELGEVINFGNRVNIDIKKGSVVLFQKYLSVKFQLNGKDYYIVRAEDIVAY